MPDFHFIEDHYNRRVTILAPRRAHRPDSAAGTVVVCPFCPGVEKREKEVYRVGGKVGSGDWEVLVLENKFPFGPHHEVVIHSQDHTKNFRRLSIDHVEKILHVYKERYIAHQEDGQVCIFHNRHHAGGESLDHPHSQLVVVPFGTHLDAPILSIAQDIYETEQHIIFCPETSQWPDEVWISPKRRGDAFGAITLNEIHDLASTMQRVIDIMALRHGEEFPYNFYIYPGTDWYVRIIPRLKTLGGFELATNIYVNTQDPKETFSFIKEHFLSPDEEKIRTIHSAQYKRSV